MLATFVTVAWLLDPQQVAITWDAPPSCPTLEHVHARVIEHLRGVVVERTEVHARVIAPALAEAPWRLRIQIGDENARELESKSCAALADAAAVMVAISLNAAIDDEQEIPEPPPVAVEDAQAAEDAQELIGPDEPAASLPSVEPIAPLPREPPPAPVAPEPRRRAPQLVLGAMTGFHVVGLPVASAQLGGRVGVRWGRLSAALTGSHWFRRERAVVGDVAASYQLGTGGLELCGALPLGQGLARFELFGCAEAELGQLRAEGLRATPSLVKRHPWLGLGGGVGAVWVFRSWIAAGLRADAVAPLLGRQFVVGEASAGAIGPVDARGTLVFELRLPRILGPR